MAAGGTAHHPLLLRPFLPSVLTGTHKSQLLRLRRNPSFRIRCCTTPPPKFSDQQPQQPEPIITPAPAATPPKPNNPFAFRRIGEDLRVDGFVLDIASIALPAALALAADPLTSLVDTAFVGHVGSVELAAVGVSISVFNFISKLFNVPLLTITTSFVAEEKALDGEIVRQEDKLVLPAVSTSLVFAAVVGISEALVLFLGSGTFVDLMGIQGSPMRIPAEQFLRLRALGAPAIATALAAQGSFRGFMDTKTPLYAVGVGNLLNAILDPILMFVFGLGIDGAALATVIADYVIAFILLWNLNTKVILLPSNFDVEKTIQYLKSGVLLTVRTVAVVGTMTLSTSMAASTGPIPMAGHQICLEVWLAVSLLNDALALAGQALLASEYTKGNYEQARTIIYRVLQIGLGTGLSLAAILFIGFGTFCSLFTTDDAVLDIARSGIIFVTASQPVNALAFVLDGLYYGVSDFSYAAYSMALVGLASSLALLILAPTFGLAGVWTGLFIFMMLRVAAGFWRLGSKRGPWKAIWSEINMNIPDR